MPRKKNTFERLALKEQIEMTKKARDVKLLHEELKNTELMKQQIDDALAQTPKNLAATTGKELKSGIGLSKRSLSSALLSKINSIFCKMKLSLHKKNYLRRVSAMLKLVIRHQSVGEKSCFKKKIKPKLIYRKEILFVTFNGTIFATKAP